MSGTEMPKVFFAKERELGLGPGCARRLHAAIRGSELVVVPATGHTVQLENPTAFNRVVKGFSFNSAA